MCRAYKIKTIIISGIKLHIGDTVAWHTSRYIPDYGNPYEEELDELMGQRVYFKKIIKIKGIEKSILDNNVTLYNILFDDGYTHTLQENDLSSAPIYKVNIPTDFEQINLVPKTPKELSYLIMTLIKRYGYNADLNIIDVSHMKYMCYLFRDMPFFNGKINKWNVSNVINMNGMFMNSDFEGDISEWNVCNVKYHNDIFKKCKIKKANRPKFLNEEVN